MLSRSITLLFLTFLPLIASAKVYTTTFQVADAYSSTEAVKLALYSSLVRRGWTVEEQKNQQTTAHLHKRNTKAKVVIDYSANQVSINTTGTRTHITPGRTRSDPETVVEKDFNPKGWIKNIVNDTKRLIPNTINQAANQTPKKENLTEQLTELKTLYEQGLISEEIYLEKQRTILL
ncbi:MULTISPECIES: SHOCT domain-containing protein [unclassified Agarivorans]|uniref:SHOCT domain-containing protein n=1 Tax=unclassified Agarivorans TaxID=2636026 RepID=UPI0026E39655|nr:MULTISPECIES: SHOCT domain-containing protein [unclassified Agarivorans]MDO6684488.1 SHOCT domain-containing protein [Agarivorans sp. 3_MG-2023]MDO6714653.1 SHOCT domain-containing protein [Agarivorans sp. 2_MG-2023]